MNEVRRTARAGWVLMAGGLVVLAAGAALRARAQAPARELASVGEQMRLRTEQALIAQARALEPKASAAARIRELQTALDMGADRATCQDLLENEEWWSPYRTFSLSAVIADGPLALLGPPVSGVEDSEVVRRAREAGLGSGVLAGNGRAFLAAAATVPTTKRRGAPAVVLIGKPLDSTALKSVAEVTGDAVGLSDGAKLLEFAGAPEAGRSLAGLVGREPLTPLLLQDEPDGTVGHAWRTGGGLWLLSSFAGPAAPRPASYWGLPLLLAGAALALVGCLIVALRRAAAQVPAPAYPGARSADADGNASGESSWGGSQPGSESDHASDENVTSLVLPSARTGGGAGAGHPASNRARVPSGPVPRSLPVPVTPHRASYPRRGPGGALAAGGEGAASVSPSYEDGSAAPAPAEQSSGRHTMGRYELIERIGEGGMAEIFFAAARGAEDFVRYFVVKRMHPHLARNQDSVNQFIDEGRLQAGLVHSNIVPVFDFGKAEGEYFLALEYIHGRDVGQIVQRHIEHFGRPLDVGTAFYIVHDVLEALSYAHSQVAKDGTPMEIVHRDVSPGNVLVSYRGEVKLTDFGIAKADRRVSRTEVGMVKGNASFMSPEQARGLPVDVRSDIFSAGLVMFYCLTNQFLYRGETTLNRLLRAAVGPATSQFNQIDQLPPPAAKVLRRALAIDPDQRYPNAVAFASDLTANMAGRPELTQLMNVLFPASLRRDLR